MAESSLHKHLIIFMVIHDNQLVGVASFNCWVWPLPDLYFQKLEPMHEYHIQLRLPAPIMLPVNQLCSWLPIMLLAINYAQNYASIIGKGLHLSHLTTAAAIAFSHLTTVAAIAFSHKSFIAQKFVKKIIIL